jgi:hypothetical protein
MLPSSKPKNKCRFNVAATLFYVLQDDYLNKICILLENMLQLAQSV